MKLTFVGAGNMAEAIIAGVCDKYEVEVIARDQKRLEELQEKYDITISKFDNQVDIEGKNIILCVKPYALEEVSKKFVGSAETLLSVLAGSTLQTLKNAVKAEYYVRIMPNLAAKYGKSMSTLCGDEVYKKEAVAICESFGQALWLGSEKEIDIATGVAGSGPAFLALVAEALSDGAVKEGLKREDANVLVRGLFEGFSPLLNENHPALLKDAVMSPGGTTAAGYAALEEGRVRDGFIKAVTKAYERAKS
ncbi:MAG TPA: pyrroline-5-carboxylate reductase [Campylobacterales bacterium]|nr:pyrroline-5-carboxylate reductase [Campylobacterales bacterium]HIP58989.1 pyrroline-5-carboxylate reductase [Campylobacterales bacterium]